MKIPNLSGLYMVGKTFMMARRPELLLAASVTATLGTAVLAAKGGYEARGIVDEAQRKRDEGTIPVLVPVPLTNKEKAQLTWQCYLPSAFACLTAVGSTAGLHLVHVKDKKAMAQMTLAAIEEIKQEAKEFEKQSAGILSEEEKSKVLEERADEDGKSHLITKDGEIEEMYLVRDEYTGRDFFSNRNRIESAVNYTNNQLIKHGNVDINTFYGDAGFPELDRGLEVGWSGAPLLKVRWSEVSREDGRAVSMFTFHPTPKKGYDDKSG